MGLKRIAAMAAIGALALTGAACGSNAPTTPGGGPVATTTFAAGTTMAKLKEAQKITIGTKFDQPLFGQKGLDGKPAGFDVEIGKIIATELGIAAFKDGTKKVCSVTGSTPAKNIEQYVLSKDKQIVLFGGYAQCVDALK